MKVTTIAIALAAGTLLATACGGNADEAKLRLRSAMDSQKPTLDDCYASALERDSAAAGEILLNMKVSKAGQIEEVLVERSDLGDGELSRCIETALVGVTLDPKPKSAIEAEYTLRLQPSS